MLTNWMSNSDKLKLAEKKFVAAFLVFEDKRQLLSRIFQKYIYSKIH